MYCHQLILFFSLYCIAGLYLQATATSARGICTAQIDVDWRKDQVKRVIAKSPPSHPAEDPDEHSDAVSSSLPTSASQLRQWQRHCQPCAPNTKWLNFFCPILEHFCPHFVQIAQMGLILPRWGPILPRKPPQTPLLYSAVTKPFRGYVRTWNTPSHTPKHPFS